MFNKKMVSVFLTIVAVLLALKELWLIVLFFWSFGEIPQEMEFFKGFFDAKNATWLSLYVLIQETGGALLIYSFVAVLSYATTKIGSVSSVTSASRAKPARHSSKK